MEGGEDAVCGVGGADTGGIQGRPVVECECVQVGHVSVYALRITNDASQTMYYVAREVNHI